jgi:hypothetical protein
VNVPPTSTPISFMVAPGFSILLRTEIAPAVFGPNMNGVDPRQYYQFGSHVNDD